MTPRVVPAALSPPWRPRVGVGEGARMGYLHAAPEAATHGHLVLRHAPHDEASHPQPGKLVPDLHRVLCKEKGWATACRHPAGKRALRGCNPATPGAPHGLGAVPASHRGPRSHFRGEHSCSCLRWRGAGTSRGTRVCVPARPRWTAWGTWATLPLPSWALPMSHCVRKFDKLKKRKTRPWWQEPKEVSAGSSSSEHGSCSFPEPGVGRAWTPRALRNHREAPPVCGDPLTCLRSPGSHPADPAFSESPAWHATCPAGTGVPLRGPTAPPAPRSRASPRSICVPQRHSTERLWLKPALLQEIAAAGGTGSHAGTHGGTESSSWCQELTI